MTLRKREKKVSASPAVGGGPSARPQPQDNGAGLPPSPCPVLSCWTDTREPGASCPCHSEHRRHRITGRWGLEGAAGGHPGQTPLKDEISGSKYLGECFNMRFTWHKKIFPKDGYWDITFLLYFKMYIYSNVHFFT